jgi:hypothetical protein
MIKRLKHTCYDLNFTPTLTIYTFATFLLCLTSGLKWNFPEVTHFELCDEIRLYALEVCFEVVNKQSLLAFL